ncbi:MAG: hypothetical protein KBS93_04350, partial [Flavobacteriaceae bacterium]|nr:hypothetical protein [Candidatus Onthonaster equi]
KVILCLINIKNLLYKGCIFLGFIFILKFRDWLTVELFRVRDCNGYPLLASKDRNGKPDRRERPKYIKKSILIY